MAAIAYHECGNLSPAERWYTMECFYNRIITNFNNNGKTVKEQLLAPKQFTGLFKYRPEAFKFDTSDSICIHNKIMAQAIICGSRLADDTIVYWASKSVDKNTRHYKQIFPKAIKLDSSFKQIYSPQ